MSFRLNRILIIGNSALLQLFLFFFPMYVNLHLRTMWLFLWGRQGWKTFSIKRKILCKKNCQGHWRDHICRDFFINSNILREFWGPGGRGCCVTSIKTDIKKNNREIHCNQKVHCRRISMSCQKKLILSKRK